MQVTTLSRQSCRPAGARPAAAARGLLPNVPSRHGRPAAQQRLRAAETDEQRPAAEPAPTAEPSAAPAAPAAPAAAGDTGDWAGEEVFYEGSGSDAELLLSLLLGATLIYLPLTLASIGRKLWIKIKVTNKRIIVTNTSPAFKGQTQVAFSNIKEIRAVPRGFGAWGDMVIFLKDKSRLELVGVDKYADIKRHIESCIYDA